ncbi:MAG: NUDIX hydrolase [Actinomycetota bacterium]
MREAEYRDASGKRLTDYDRPSVAVDTALLTVGPRGGLMVLEVKRQDGGGWALPGTFLWKGERLADAVRRSLKTKVGLDGVEPHQMQVFDDPERDDRGWVLSVAHWAVVAHDQLETRLADQTRLMPVDNPGRLIYDHQRIIAKAVDRIRLRYQQHPDPDLLLGENFTILELRLLHQAVAGEPFDRDWFRREMRHKLLATGRVTEGTRGRPAELFQRKTAVRNRSQRRSSKSAAG